jgi:hypothetical protein
MTKFFVYETIARGYVIGTDDLCEGVRHECFRVLKLGRSSADALQSTVDSIGYGTVQFQALWFFNFVLDSHYASSISRMSHYKDLLKTEFSIHFPQTKQAWSYIFVFLRMDFQICGPLL